MRSLGKVYFCTGRVPNHCFKSIVKPVVKIDGGTYLCIEVSDDKKREGAKLEDHRSRLAEK
jgi:hypothetical protein